MEAVGGAQTVVGIEAGNVEVKEVAFVSRRRRAQIVVQRDLLKPDFSLALKSTLCRGGETSSRRQE